MPSMTMTGIHTYMSKGLNELLAAGCDGCCDNAGAANSIASNGFDGVGVEAAA